MTAARTVDDSRVEMTEIVLPEDSNARGTIFGGRVLSLIDKCAAVVAMRHAKSLVLTAAVDSVVFLSSVHVGDVLVLRGWINAAFRSSMEIEVEVYSEHPLRGGRDRTTRAFVTMVSVDGAGRPQAAPELTLRSDEERARAAAAAERRRTRLSRRSD